MNYYEKIAAKKYNMICKMKTNDWVGEFCNYLIGNNGDSLIISYNLMKLYGKS